MNKAMNDKAVTEGVRAAPHPDSAHFPENARAALADPDLQTALRSVEVNFIARRREVADRLPEFEALRDSLPRSL
jgi:L-lactate utilization protein LutB